MPNNRLAAMCAAVFVLVLSAAPRAAADGGTERFDLLYTRGVLALEAGEYTSAEQFFSDAAALNPGDAPCLLQLATARNRLGDYGGALAAAERAEALGVGLEGLALEKGCALAGLGRYDAALPFLETALRESPGDEGFTRYLMGICRAGRGNDAGAIECFALAEGVSLDLAPYAGYRRALSLARLGRRAEAQSILGELALAEPIDSSFRAELENALRGLRDKAPPKRWAFSAMGRYEYDSNVMLAPDSGEAGQITQHGDWRYLDTFRLDLDPIVTPRFVFSTDYQFVQSLHQTFTGYDLLGHELEPRMTFDLGSVSVYAGYGFDYCFLDGGSQDYFRMHSIFAGAEMPYSRYGFGRLSYRYSTGDYFLDYADPADNLDVRNAHAVGYDHYILPGGKADRYLRVGFSWDRTDTSGDNYFYDGYNMIAEALLPIACRVSLNLSAGYRIRDFSRGEAGRFDRCQEYRAMLIRPLTDCIDVALDYTTSYNSSTESAFRYDRDLFSMVVACHF